MTAKILVVGGSHSDVPLIESSLLYGLEVYTTGNQPDHPGHVLSAGYLPADFSRPEEIKEVAKKLKVDFIVPGANDYSMLSAAYVAQELDLPGFDSYETVKTLHLKDRFKKFSQQISLPIGRFQAFNDLANFDPAKIEKEMDFPVIIKPIDLTGGKGISRVDHLHQLSAAIEAALGISKTTSFVLEDWFQGSLHSYSTVVEAGKIIFDYFDTEFCIFQPYLVSTSMSRCLVPDAVKDLLSFSTQKVVDHLKLVDGVLHCQFMFNAKGCKILEYTRRMSGDLYSRVVQSVRGIRHSDLFIASILGESLAPLTQPTLCQNAHVSRHCITADKSGEFAGIWISDRLRPYIQSVTPIVHHGKHISDDGRSKVAVVIAQYPSYSEMYESVLDYSKLMKCRVNQ
jgi:biotin carboxylase